MPSIANDFKLGSEGDCVFSGENSGPSRRLVPQRKNARRLSGKSKSSSRIPVRLKAWHANAGNFHFALDELTGHGLSCMERQIQTGSKIDLSIRADRGDPSVSSQIQALPAGVTVARMTLDHSVHVRIVGGELLLGAGRLRLENRPRTTDPE